MKVLTLFWVLNSEISLVNMTGFPDKLTWFPNATHCCCNLATLLSVTGSHQESRPACHYCISNIHLICGFRYKDICHFF